LPPRPPEGYAKDSESGEKSLSMGYYFKILQGPGEACAARGLRYVVKGNMILGFGLVAYPAKDGSSRS